MADLLSGEAGDCPSAEFGDRRLGSWMESVRRIAPGRAIGGASAPSAHLAAVERNDLAARRSVGTLPRRSVGALLGKLLGNPQQPLPALHLHPHVLGMDAGGDPKHREIVEKVGAFAHHGIVIAV